MLKKIIPSLFIFCASSALMAADLDKPLSLEIGGRVKAETINGQTAYVYSWPGIYFVGQFSGTEVEARFNDDQNYLALSVDDQAPIVITKPGKSSFRVKGLAAGHHQIRLEKMTETQGSQGRFEGFFVAADAQAETPKVPQRAIEFIGDSHTVGYANTSTTRDCTSEQVFKTTDNTKAFGPLVAKHFNAAYQINASSGFGIVRNYNGTSPGKSLLTLYPFALNDGSTPVAGDWSPQIIVIGLGTNDFSTPLNAGEPWANRDALHADYVAHYVDFVRQLHQKHPKAFFILLSSEGGNEFSQQVDAVADQLKKVKNLHLQRLIYKGLESTSCHWHPSEKDDQAMTKLLVDFIEQQKGLW